MNADKLADALRRMLIWDGGSLELDGAALREYRADIAFARKALAEHDTQPAQAAQVSDEVKVDLIACDWQEGALFGVHDEPGEHDPCYLVLPSNEMIPFVHHAVNGVDQARAQFIADCCNQVLSPIQQPVTNPPAQPVGVPDGWALTKLREHEAACQVCGRAVWDGNAEDQTIGWLAPCGRRVARIKDCGTVDCVEMLTATAAPQPPAQPPAQPSADAGVADHLAMFAARAAEGGE